MTGAGAISIGVAGVLSWTLHSDSQDERVNDNGANNRTLHDENSELSNFELMGPERGRSSPLEVKYETHESTDVTDFEELCWTVAGIQLRQHMQSELSEKLGWENYAQSYDWYGSGDMIIRMITRFSTEGNVIDEPTFTYEEAVEAAPTEVQVEVINSASHECGFNVYVKNDYIVDLQS